MFGGRGRDARTPMKSFAIGIAARIAAGIAVTVLLALHATDSVELPVRDAAMRLLPRRAAESTAIVAIEAASLAKPMPVPVGRSIAPAFRTAPRDIPQVSAVDLLMWDGFSTRPPPEGRPLRSRGRVENPSHIVLSGKIVFIGLTAVAL